MLSDENKRKMYDQFGHQGVDGGMGDGNYNGFGGMSAEDIFNQFTSMFGGGGQQGQDFGNDFFGFGQRQSRTAPTRGSDIEYSVNLPFMDGIKGCK